MIPVYLLFKSAPSVAHRGVMIYHSLQDETMDATRSIANTFVGRQYEIELVRRIVEETSSGLSRIVTISGEPGIGKSSLAN